MIAKNLLTGLPGFTLVASGQLLSLVGSEMTWFALTIWAYEKTGLATSLALMGFFHFLPLILLSPVAGVWVDRGNRKLMMMLSDFGAVASTLMLLLLFSLNQLEVWHLYLAGAISGAFSAFQWPAYSAAISTMVRKEDYGRANGMISLAESAAGIGAPILAAVLLPLLGLGGILWVDLISFSLAFATLIAVRVPQPAQSEAGRQSRGSLLSEAAYGFKFIFARPSLLGLQLTFLFSNLVATLGNVVQPAMLLARTSNDEASLAAARTAAGVGGVIGGILLSVWGGPRGKVHGVLLGMALSSFFGSLLMGLGQSVWIWVVSSFLAMLIIPILNGSNQAIWQAKVPPDVQGKVFSSRRLIAWIANPIATLMAGPLVDRWLTPAMMPQGSLAGAFGPLVGTGPGAGIALLMVVTGAIGIGVGLLGYLSPAIRQAETLLPDHDQTGR